MTNDDDDNNIEKKTNQEINFCFFNFNLTYLKKKINNKYI